MQLLRFYIVCDGCGCNYYAMDVFRFLLYAMDVGAITRFLHCMRWMWVQLLRFSLYVMDVGAINIVCDGCGCNY